MTHEMESINTIMAFLISVQLSVSSQPPCYCEYLIVASIFFSSSTVYFCKRKFTLLNGNIVLLYRRNTSSS